MTQEVQKHNETAVNPRETSPRRDVTPVVTLSERDDAYLLDVLLPGVDESDVTLSTEDRALMIEAINHSVHPEGFTMIREEFPEVRYRGVYELPEHIDPDGIKAELKLGVLQVRLPKREAVKPRKIAVKAG